MYHPKFGPAVYTFLCSSMAGSLQGDTHSVSSSHYGCSDDYPLILEEWSANTSVSFYAQEERSTVRALSLPHVHTGSLPQQKGSNNTQP
jgi:hypothetical protein